MNGIFMGFVTIGMAVGGITGLCDLLARIYNWAKYGSGYGSTICDFFGVGCNGLIPDWVGLNKIFIMFFNAPLCVTGTLTFIVCALIAANLDVDGDVKIDI